MSREDLLHEKDLLDHKDRWTTEDAKRFVEIGRELAALDQDVPVQRKERDPIPENQTLPYSLAKIREVFGRK